MAADALSDQAAKAVVVVALVLQDLDSVVLYPASALGAEVAFPQRADAVACQVVVELFVAPWLAGLPRLGGVRDAPGLVVAVARLDLLAMSM